MLASEKGQKRLTDVLQRRILIIDHEPEHRAHLTRMLEDGGFQNILTAPSGHQALSVLQLSLQEGQSDIQAILLHTRLPDMDAYSLGRRLHEHVDLGTIPILLLSPPAADQAEIIRSGYTVGATDILFDPIPPTELLPRLTTSLFLKIERDLRKHRERELQTELVNYKATEARLEYLVAHDDLTGLYNRRRLEQLLELSVISAHHHQRTGALCYLDLDQFKVINDSEGHNAGDNLLVHVAAILRDLLGNHATIAHISSDEFAVLIDNTTEHVAMETAEAIRQALDEFKYQAGKKTYYIGVSIGVAMIYPRDKVTASEILAQADQACYMAKVKGRNRVHKYNSGDSVMHALQSDVYWGPQIRHALTHDRFRLVFQPVLQLSDDKITHYEVLIRMLGDEDQLIEPANFIPIAERMGLIQEVDFWVIGAALDWLHNLPAHLSHLAVNINLSTQGLADPALLPLLRDKLRVTGVDARRITFEITETAAIANIGQTRKVVEQIRALGCQFALDDFGAGFNSYNYLKHFPVDYLKIDGIFIVNLVNDPVDQALVKSMIEIAHTLGKKTVAEFVETAEALKLLKEYGVDYAQGHYLGKPQAALVRY
ncbi:MAG: EAL domain-containing protein [Gammaproteobacteria bacterium]|nr:EAL domain-containing protein [Gammaproteobacteria bacterium]